MLVTIIYIEGKSVARHLWGDELRAFVKAFRIVARLGGKSETVDLFEAKEDERREVV